MTHDYDSICSAVREALTQRDSRRNVLARRIEELAAKGLSVARSKRLDLGEAGILEYRVPVADCSQWANRMDCPDHRGDSYLALYCGTVRSLGPVPDVGFFDGSNMQHQQGPTRDLDTGERVRPATVKMLRDVARALPTALAALLAETQGRAERQASAADTALAEL